MKHTVLSGGVGAARYLKGAVEAFDPADVTAVVNVADDVTLHGLRVCPDLDTCTYTLAGAIDPQRGWGLVDESFKAMAALRRYGGLDWFSLGDQDLGTHLYRTQRLIEGATLTEVTSEICDAWGVRATLAPVSDDPIETRVTLRTGEEIGFQDYFVRLAHSVEISSVRFVGAEQARPSAVALEAIESAETLVIAPSNPAVSIQPVLAVGAIEAAVRARPPGGGPPAPPAPPRRSRNVAVSPIVGGKALKGPADRMLRELGEQATVVGVARRYQDLVATMVIDETDTESAGEIEKLGMRVIAVPTVMSEPGVAQALAETCHQAGAPR
ncbi:MAG: 2-phospho-L-lactate transferase [Acidimicrobiia bacterium]|nr:2-phospho-L-lactate transferase [Acidimicrobiia bacterium]